MSWAVEEWKEGLSTRVLHKIQELESQLEKLKKERQRRQFQVESLDAALQKQKQKVESEKTEGATLKRENQSLTELCDNLEKTRQKLSHELQVKESQVSFQEGQLILSKKQVERLEQELKRYKSELERSQQTLVAGDSSVSNTPQKSFTVPSTPCHSDAKFEELQTKYEKEIKEKKRLEAELKSVKSHFVAAEEKIKRLSEELNCQRQNSESVQRSLEQKIKEKEKDYQEELSCQLDQLRAKLQEELHQAKNNYSLLQVDLEKIRLEKEKLGKNASDFTLKLKAADQAMETMQLKENELRRNFEEVKLQNSLLSSQSGQQSQEVCQLKEDLHAAKQLLQQSQSLAEEMKSKKWSLERELQILKDKLNKQDESLEKMQRAVFDLEKQRDSLQQLLQHEKNTTEKLSIKLKDVESLENILAECESLKKEAEILSLWKTENEQLLDQFRSEKEGLMSKMYSLESALMMEQIKSNDRVTVVEAENEHLSKEIKKLRCVAEEKSTELEAQRIAYAELQQKTITSEEKYQKEKENNSLKLAELTKQVNILQQMLQSAANEALEKEKCISSLETSLASHMQLNASFQKQFEELIRDEMERKLAEAEQKHEGFLRESEEHISKLRVVLSEKEGLVTKASAALEEKDKQLQFLIKESKRQETEIQDLKVSNEMLKDSVQQLKVMPQTASYQEPDLSAATSLSEKEIEGFKDKNFFISSAVDTSEQKHVNLMEINLQLSNNSKDKDENLSELSERHREKSTLFLQVEEGLERKCTLLEANNSNLECSLRAHGCHFEVERAEFEYREKQLMSEHEEVQCQLLSLEEKNKILLRQLEKMQVALEEAEIVPDQNFLSPELDSLESKSSRQNTMHQHYNTLLQENKQLIEEMKIKNKHAKSCPSLNKASLEQLRISVKEKEDELDKYQVKLELLQMDLEDKEVSVENYADQVKQLEAALRTMETKIEENEREKEGLKQEIEALKELENFSLEIAERDGNGQSTAVFNAVTKDNFNQQIDAKCSSVPRDTMPSQNDYVQLVSSLHMTMSKLNELEKMCEHLQTEKSTLALQLKDSQLECVIGTDTMVEELISKINMLKEEHAAFSDGLEQSEMEAQSDCEKMNFVDLECCTELNYEDLKSIKAHFDGVKEKILSMKNQYKCLHEQNMNMASSLSELQCSIEMLKKENTALSRSLNQADSISFITQVTPSHINKEFLLDGKLCLCSSCQSSTASLTESNVDSDHYRPTNAITKHNSNNKESIPDHHHSITELCDGDLLIHIIKQGHTVTEKYSPKNKIEHLMLCEAFDKSFRRLEESFEACKNLEDEEIQKIQQLLLLAREEVDYLRQQNVLDNEQWQQKMHHVILEVVSKLPAKQNDSELLPQVLEEPRRQSQDLNSSSQLLLCVGTERVSMSVNFIPCELMVERASRCVEYTGASPCGTWQ
ncbi:UNVERIFIED_CONTAM: hypothetical protein K2H54_049109 [Gekko kuhli]